MKYKIKQISELTGVTVRTLQYYDEIGLLVPGIKTKDQHRLYGDQEILLLQQIMVLKSMGLSLKQVQFFMDNSDADLAESLQTQVDKLHQQSERSKKLAQLLENSLSDYRKNNDVDWENATKVIKLIQMGEVDFYTWVDNYFTKEERARVTALFDQLTPEEWEAFTVELNDVFDFIGDNLDTDPKGETGKIVVERMSVLIDRVFSDYPVLSKKFWLAYKTDTIPPEFSDHPRRKEIIDYMGIAFDTHHH